MRTVWHVDREYMLFNTNIITFAVWGSQMYFNVI